MGLDMTINKKTYIGANYSGNGVKGKIKLTRKGYDESIGKVIDEPIKIKMDRVTYVIEELAYWRKNYELHNWFVANLSETVETCRDSIVDRYQLEDLIQFCRDRAQSAYDNDKRSDWFATAKKIRSILTYNDDEYFYYHPS